MAYCVTELMVFMVFKNKERSDESSSMVSKTPSSKFISKKGRSDIQYSTNSPSVGQDFLYSKYNEQDVQAEFLRVYTQLEVLRERNMRVGNRHLASKIIAMQDAARTHDNVQAENFETPVKSSSSLGIIADSSGDEVSPIKIKRQSVSFAAEPKANGDTTAAKETPKIEEECASSSTYPSTEKNETKGPGDNNGKYLMSGHARTHSIVINLDDKSRFTDEITV
ncbi:hypothetical protein NQ315_014670 [Exocentrus adspersus]|uniref:Uncharacterized protein n=1 Tax=Exocentrus adspersus TaxID=1586481 RepID=A0AAV8VQA3_9CUCU|nr:hypothetical protein NQ315_014670 [Exocentrus adspersus]